MKLYFLEAPKLPFGTRKDPFATFSHLGTWTDGHLCPGCSRSTSRLTEPLLVEWNPSSVTIGDFSYCGYTVIVPPSVRDVLIAHGFEFEYRRLEVVASPPRARRRDRVPFPYCGPDVSWIYPRETVPLDPAASSVSILNSCDVCHENRWTFRRDGIVIRAADWQGQRVFRISQFKPSGAVVITHEGAEILLNRKFTNLGLHEIGEIV